MIKRCKIRNLPVNSNLCRENLQSAKICSKTRFLPSKLKYSLWKTKMSLLWQIWKRIKTLNSCCWSNLKKRKPNFKANWLKRLLLWENGSPRPKTNLKRSDWSSTRSRTRKWHLRENYKTWRTSLMKVWLKPKNRSNCAFRRRWELETTKMWLSAIRTWMKRIGTCWPNWTSSTKSWRKLKKLINFWRRNRFRLNLLLSWKLKFLAKMKASKLFCARKFKNLAWKKMSIVKKLKRSKIQQQIGR